MQSLQERICDQSVVRVQAEEIPNRKEVDMGVFKRGKIYYIRYQGPTGKEIRASTGQESKRLAEQILAKRKTELAEDKFLDKDHKPTMTAIELCDWYWTHHGRHRRGHGIDGILKRFRRFFGKTPIAAITPERVSQYVEFRRSNDGVRPSTINKDLQLLKSIFNRIIDYRRWRKVLENPVCYVKLAKENHSRVRFLDDGEINSLVEACPPHLKPIVVVALRTGMRRGEILSLRWSDVDLARRVILIRRSKNGESRYVPVSDDLLEVLISLPSRLRRGYLFPSFLPARKGSGQGLEGRPFVEIKNSFREAVKRAGIEDFRFHDLRHTFASHLVMQGADLNTVRELLGHKSLQMTLRYAHLSAAHNRDAIQLIDKALGPVGCAGTGTPTGTPKVVPFRRRR